MIQRKFLWIAALFILIPVLYSMIPALAQAAQTDGRDHDRDQGVTSEENAPAQPLSPCDPRFAPAPPDSGNVPESSGMQCPSNIH